MPIKLAYERYSNHKEKNMSHPLMPKATAVWLIDNTTLTFNQIANFCGLHELEVQAIADAEVAIGMQGLDPVAAGALTTEEIKRCEEDHASDLKIAEARIPEAIQKKQKGARYTPVAKRQDRPDAIAWLLKNYPEITDAQISRLIGTTKPTINSIRNRSHWNTPNITPQNPVSLGLCSADELEKVLLTAKRKMEKLSNSSGKNDSNQNSGPPNPTNIPIEDSPQAPAEDGLLTNLDSQAASDNNLDKIEPD